jgi:pimeloyl-ACP methyl ester carboxylesterase
VNLIRWEELSDVILCGHSYGGCVISGVADRIPDRVGALVYLDAFVLENGQSLHDVLPPPMRDAQLEQARDSGEGWKVPPIPAEAFHVNARDLDWVNRQCTMQPLATFQECLDLTGEIGKIENVTFILANGWTPSPFSSFCDQAKAKGWRTVSMECGHDVMLDLPEELTRELLAVSARRSASAD